MPLDVAVYTQGVGQKRSATICDAMLAGIAAVGDRPRLIHESRYVKPEADVAVFYGLAGKLESVFKDYSSRGKTAVYIDLGYWARRQGGNWAGYHKIAVNARHPTAYFQRVKHAGDRAAMLGIKIAPWRTEARHIVVAGMSEKAARHAGFFPEEFERSAINIIKLVTSRPIIYRPKPTWSAAAPIEGVGYSSSREFIDDVLVNCHALVTHHSNAAVDALCAGVPVFCQEGAAAALACSSFADIERPIFPEGRQQFVNDLAYCQWTIGEMWNGAPWRHLKNEGLVG